jgi:hypothetical protein
MKKLRYNAPVEFWFFIHSGDIDPIQSDYQEDLHRAVALQDSMQIRLGSGCLATRDSLTEISLPDGAIAMESVMLRDHAYMSTAISRFLQGILPAKHKNTYGRGLTANRLGGDA